jgi:hypothetical protein
VASIYLILVLAFVFTLAVSFSASKVTKLLRELKKGGQSAAFEVNVRFRMLPQPRPKLKAPRGRESLPDKSPE